MSYITPRILWNSQIGTSGICHIGLIMKFLDTFVFPLLLFRDLDGFVLVKSPKVLANVMVSSTYLAY